MTLWLCLQPRHPKRCANTGESQALGPENSRPERANKKGAQGEHGAEQPRWLCGYGTKTRTSRSAGCSSASLPWHVTNATARCSDTQTEKKTGKLRFSRAGASHQTPRPQRRDDGDRPGSAAHPAASSHRCSAPRRPSNSPSSAR